MQVSFISENAITSFLLSVVDIDNPDPSPLKKVIELTSKPPMLQWMLSTSNQREDLSVHEIDVEKGMNEFSDVIDQSEEEHYWMKKTIECLE